MGERIQEHFDGMVRDGFLPTILRALANACLREGRRQAEAEHRESATAYFETGRALLMLYKDFTGKVVAEFCK